MKLKFLLYTSASVALTLGLVSCDDDSSSSTLEEIPESAFDQVSSGSVATDSFPAPITLDKTKFSILGIDDFSFYFNRTGGSAINGGTETGFCDSFGTTTGTFSLPLGSGNTTEYDLPDFVTDISYTYSRSSDGNSGVLVISGNGVGDGGSRTGTDGLGNRMDIYVGSPFTATLNVSFGSSGSVVDNISIDSSVTGTSDFFFPTFTYNVNSSQNNVSLTLQDGSPVSLGYNSAVAANVSDASPDPIFPTSLQAVGEVDLTFNPATIGTSTTAQYQLRNITSSPQGFANATDQGILTLELLDSVGTITSSQIAKYRWDTNSTSNNVANLSIESSVGGSITTETFLFDFTTNGSGNFNQTQPANGVTGVFSLPFILNPVEEEDSSTN